MPYFQIPGFGKKTGNKRSRKYYGINLEDALERAYRDDMIVDIAAVQQVAGPTATEAQKRLCEELGIQYPAEVDKEHLSIIIDQAMQNPIIKKKYLNLPPTEAQLDMAKNNEIKIWRGITRIELSQLITKMIDDQRIELDN